MIRVLQYIGSLEQGGSQAMIMNIYRNIDREKIQFDFVIHAGGMTQLAKEAMNLGAEVYTCPAYSFRTAIRYSNWWKRFFEEHREYGIVHSHVRSTAAIVLNIAKKSGCTTIAHSHNTSSGNGISALVKNLLQYRIRFVADYFFACSKAAGEWLYGKQICSSERFYIIKNAINAEKYRYDKGAALQVRQELGFKDEDIIIGHVGRFVDQKNHSFLIDVFRYVNEKDKRMKLLLVGDGELRNEIEDKIRLYGLEDDVVLTGTRTDVDHLMMAMDLFVFPSKFEGLGIVLIEAQASGCPCIASDVVPKEAKISDLVRFVPKESTAEEWGEVILAMHEEERKDMSKAVRDSGYDIDTTAKWIMEFYNNI